MSVAIFLAGCVVDNHDRVLRLHTGYDHCRELHGEQHPQCQILLEQLRTEEEKYLDQAQENWKDDFVLPAEPWSTDNRL